MSERGVTCLVTIHGMGFQRAPDDEKGIEGYADLLHEHLYTALKGLGADVLSDDPQRRRQSPGQNGPIYVQSQYQVPNGGETVEEGLRRLGRWVSEQRGGPGLIDPTGAPLVETGKRLSHVALVYSHPENRALQHLGAAAEGLLKAAASFLHYGTPWDIVHMAVQDLLPAPGRKAAAPERVSLRPRPTPRHPQDLSQPPGVLGVLRALEEDVTTYVVRNDLRENVRGFVREALLRLCSRSDVEGIVINAHSQGTVVAFDAVRSLPPFAARQVRYLLTSGSPLRKYADLFTWGADVASISLLEGWTNFWDCHDIVADPLGPADYTPGSCEVRPSPPSLFQQADDQGAVQPYLVSDRRVDNRRNSPAEGYPAHNYWDNQQEWTPDVSQLLVSLLAKPPTQAAAATASRSLIAP